MDVSRIDQILRGDQEVRQGDFAAHTDASGDPDVIFSPGTKVDGSSFP